MLEQMLITNLQRISLNSKPLPQTRLKTLPNVMTSHCLIPSGGPKTETASRIFLDFNAILKLYYNCCSQWHASDSAMALQFVNSRTRMCRTLRIVVKDAWAFDYFQIKMDPDLSLVICDLEMRKIRSRLKSHIETGAHIDSCSEGPRSEFYRKILLPIGWLPLLIYKPGCFMILYFQDAKKFNNLPMLIAGIY